MQVLAGVGFGLGCPGPAFLKHTWWRVEETTEEGGSLPCRYRWQHMQPELYFISRYVNTYSWMQEILHQLADGLSMFVSS